MPYDATNLTALDETKPVGSLEAVDILDDALRETRSVFKSVLLSKHTSTGDHQADSITNTHIINDAVTTAKVLDGAITLPKLAAGVMSGANLTDGTITVGKLANDAVETLKIKDANVTESKLAGASVTVTKLGIGAVTPVKMSGGGGAGQILVSQTDGTWLSRVVSGAGELDLNGVLSLTNALPVAKYSDIKTSGTEGGSAFAAGWVTRELNSEEYDESNIGSLTANRITLNAGTYLCFAEVPGYRVGRHKARLMNITGTPAAVLNGSSEFSDYRYRNLAEYTQTSGTSTIRYRSKVIGAAGYSIQVRVLAPNGAGTIVVDGLTITIEPVAATDTLNSLASQITNYVPAANLITAVVTAGGTDPSVLETIQLTENLFGLLGGGSSFDTGAQTKSKIVGVFSIIAAQQLELQHYVSTTSSQLGLGVPVSAAGVSEVYSQILFIQLGTA